jgi:hypothetical protein
MSIIHHMYFVYIVPAKAFCMRAVATQFTLASIKGYLG